MRSHPHGEMQWVQRINDVWKEMLSALRPAHDTLAAGARLLRNPARLHEEDNRPDTANAFYSAAERYYLMPNIDRWVSRALG